MGRTLLPFRPALEQEIQKWKAFKDPLSPEECKIFETLMQMARQHGDSGSLAGRTLITETIFMGICLEQQAQITELQTQIAHLRQKIRYKN